MAKPGVLKEFESKGVDLNAAIPAMVNQEGQKGAATALGVSVSTISQWLKTNGFVARTIYTRPDGIVEVVPDAATRDRLAALIIPEVE